GGSQPARLGRQVRRAQGRALLRLPGARLRRPGREGRGGNGRRLLRPLHRPHPRDEGELQDHPPVPRATPRRARHCESCAQLQAARGRLLRAARECPRRHGLVRGERRDGVPLPLQDPHRLLRRHQHRAEGEPQPHDRRPDRRDREPRPGRAGDRPLMQEFVDGLVADPSWVHYLGAMLAFGGIVVFGFVLPIAGITTWVERRVAGRIQSRIGPNRTGPAGFLQWLADGIKSLLKRDVVPDAADAPLFKLAPYVVMTGFVGAFVAIPFGGPLIIADLNVGILYITAVTALVVVGILMAGWSSNNKWSLLGGIRSAAQIVSYEIAAGCGTASSSWPSAGTSSPPARSSRRSSSAGGRFPGPPPVTQSCAPCSSSRASSSSRTSGCSSRSGSAGPCRASASPR